MSTLDSMTGNGGPNRIVWEVLYAYDHQHRQNSDMSNADAVWWTREQRIEHIIAPTHAMARAAWDYRHPFNDYPGRRLLGDEFVSAVPICTVNHEVAMTDWRHGT